MRMITLEDHFATPMFQEMFRRGTCSSPTSPSAEAIWDMNISANCCSLGSHPQPL